jgi:TRAP-type C4-dicarboxylate transport system substrate-binding protein
MTSTRPLAAAFAAALALAAPAAAKETIKLATLAPQGSVWDLAMREMGARWSRDTGGRVALVVYPGGVAGDEADLVRKMRIGQLQGAGLTVTGLAQIDPAFLVFHVPMMIESWSELDAVLTALRPELERRLEAKGYVLLHWAHGGWLYLFSREPVRTVGDLKRQKLFVWAGDDERVQQWRRHGFQPVALDATQVLLGLQTKLIDVVPATPIVCLSLQWFRQATSMLDLGLAPLVGGVIVKKDLWDRLAPADQEAVRAAAREAEQRLATGVPEKDAESIAEMKKRGLTVTAPSAAEAAEWRRAADEFLGTASETATPPEILAVAKQALAAARAGAGGPR